MDKIKIIQLAVIAVLTIVLMLLVGLLLMIKINQPSQYSNPVQPTNTPIPTNVPTPSPSPSPTQTPTPAPTPLPTKPPISYVQAFVTFYGWPDNTPSGKQIAYPKSRYKNALHEEAGGTGTFEDPVTFASAESVYQVGTRVYVPYLKKYAIKEDWCVSCSTNPIPHIDIWMESGESFTQELNQCLGNFTRQSEAIEINPPRGRPVDTTPWFNQQNGECLK